MKRFLLLCVMCVVLAPGLVSGNSHDAPGGRSPRLDLSIGYNRSLEHGHLLVGSVIAVPADRFDIGAGVRGYFGLGHEGQYLAPYLRVEFPDLATVSGPDASDEQQLSASLYVGLGPVFVLRPSEDITDSRGGLMLLVGTQGPIAYAGPGVLSFDAGIELSPPPPYRGGTDTGDSILDGILGFFQYFLADSGYRWKASVGL
ncbi:MAG: hypothetical protein EA383_16810, partial [Spirochaetaceae bacterium]